MTTTQEALRDIELICEHILMLAYIGNPVQRLNDCAEAVARIKATASTALAQQAAQEPQPVASLSDDRIWAIYIKAQEAMPQHANGRDFGIELTRRILAAAPAKPAEQEKAADELRRLRMEWEQEQIERAKTPGEVLRRAAERAEPSQQAPSTAAQERDAVQVVEIDREGSMFWHRNCDSRFSSPMKEVKRESDRSLIQCAKCGHAGYYPVGGVGLVCAALAHKGAQGEKA